MKVLFGLLSSVVLLAGGFWFFSPYYFAAVKQRAKESIVEVVSPEIHAEAARQALSAAEHKLVSAMQHSTRQLKKLDQYRRELTEVESLRVELSNRLMKARDLLKTGGLDANAMEMLGKEVSLLVTAHDEALERETKLRDHVNSAVSKHDELKGHCEQMMAQIEAKKLALSESVSRAEADQAEMMLEEAAEIVMHLEEHPSFGREAKEILSSLKSPVLKNSASGKSTEMLMAEIDASLGKR